jgi:hypothetical protein
MGKSPFLMGKSPFVMGKSPFLMGKSTINGHFNSKLLVYNWAKADDLHKSYVARPVGNLVLKGRKSATKVGEHRTLRARNPGIHKDFMGQNDGF